MRQTNDAVARPTASKARQHAETAASLLRLDRRTDPGAATEALAHALTAIALQMTEPE